MVEVFCRSGHDRTESLHDDPRTEPSLGKRKSQLYSKEKCIWEKLKNPLISFPTPSILMLLFIPHRLVYRYSKAEKASCILVLEWKGGKATMTSNAIVANCIDPPLPTEWHPRRKHIHSPTSLRFCTISFKLYFRFHCYISSTQKALSAFNPRTKERNPKLLNYLLLKNLALTGVPGWRSRLSAGLLALAQVMILGSWDQAPCGAPPSAWSRLQILFPSAPPTVLSLSLSKIN